jgi:hypothetical protein
MIIRTSRKNRFTVIPNDLLEDPSLDWKDLGLLVYLLSKPDNWEISVEHLKKQRKLGRDGIYKCLDAIIAAGYARREKKKDGSVDWYIFDDKENAKNNANPVIKPNPEKTEKAKQSQIRKTRNTGNPNPENPTQVSTEYKQDLKEKISTENISIGDEQEIDEDDELTIAQLSKFKPDPVDSKLWDKFLKARKKRKAVQSQRAIQMALTELKKCNELGISMNDAIGTYLANTWKGLEADWIQNKQKSPISGVNRIPGQKHPQQRPDYSVLGGNFIDSTAKVIN